MNIELFPPKNVWFLKRWLVRFPYVIWALVQTWTVTRDSHIRVSCMSVNGLPASRGSDGGLPHVTLGHRWVLFPLTCLRVFLLFVEWEKELR